MIDFFGVIVFFWTKVVEITEGTGQSHYFATRWWRQATELTWARLPVLSTELASQTGGRAITCVGAWIAAVDRGHLGAERIFVMIMTDAIPSLGEAEKDLEPLDL